MFEDITALVLSGISVSFVCVGVGDVGVSGDIGAAAAHSSSDVICSDDFGAMCVNVDGVGVPDSIGPAATYSSSDDIYSDGIDAGIQ